MIEDDELVADCIDLLAGLVVEASLELASLRDVPALADELLQVLRQHPDIDVGEWLLEHDEVTELFIDSEELAARATPIVRRIREGDPAPCWNDALAAMIGEAPDDLNARRVFGDWLEEAGDPRGELVALQLQLAATPDEELRRRETLFLRRYHTYLLGPLADLPDPRVVWRFGFFDTLTVEAAVLPAVLAHPSIRLLRELTVTSIIEFPDARLPGTLIGLELFAADEAESVVRVDAATAGLSLLEELAIMSFRTIELGLATALPRLRKLFLRDAVLEPPRAWCDGLPALEELVLYNVQLADRSQLFKLFDAPPARLHTLRIHECDAIAELLVRLLTSTLLAQLRTLDLRNNDALSGALDLLREHAARFAHLELLDVRYSNVEDAAALGPHVRAADPVHQSYNDADDDEEEEDENEDEDEDEDDDEDGYELDDELDPDHVPEDETEEETEEADADPAEVGVDRDAPIEERYEEPE